MRSRHAETAYIATCNAIAYANMVKKSKPINFLYLWFGPAFRNLFTHSDIYLPIHTFIYTFVDFFHSYRPIKQFIHLLKSNEHSFIIHVVIYSFVYLFI